MYVKGLRFSSKSLVTAVCEKVFAEIKRKRMGIIRIGICFERNKIIKMSENVNLLEELTVRPNLSS